MRLTRRQLRKLIVEAIEAGPHGVWRVPRKDRSPRVSTGKLTKDRFHGTAPKKKLLDLKKVRKMFLEKTIHLLVE